MWKGKQLPADKGDEFDIDPMLECETSVPFYFYIKFRKNRMNTIKMLAEKGNKDTERRLKGMKTSGTALDPKQEKLVMKSVTSQKLQNKIIARARKKFKKLDLRIEEIEAKVDEIKAGFKTVDKMIKIKYAIWYDVVSEDTLRETIFVDVYKSHGADALKRTHELYWKLKDRTAQLTFSMPSDEEVEKYKSQNMWKPIL